MPNVIIVEDHLEILEMLVTVMGRFFTVQTAINGKEGLRMIREQKPDLALLDINVPGIDGLSICKILKEDADTRNIKVIILTAAYADDSGKALGLAAGADAFLTKPIKSHDLLERAHQLLGLAYPKG